MASQQLKWWREDHARWAELGCVLREGQYGWSEDVNREARADVLRLLATEGGDADAGFMRYLLQQETAMHAVPGGYGDTLRLAALLLAERGDVTDVWQLWEAKTTSFDTYSGLDGVVLLGAGRTPTLAYVQAADHSDRDKLLEYLADVTNDDYLTDDDIRERLSSLRSYLRE